MKGEWHKSKTSANLRRTTRWVSALKTAGFAVIREKGEQGRGLLSDRRERERNEGDKTTGSWPTGTSTTCAGLVIEQVPTKEILAQLCTFGSAMRYKRLCIHKRYLGLHKYLRSHQASHVTLLLHHHESVCSFYYNVMIICFSFCYLAVYIFYTAYVSASANFLPLPRPTASWLLWLLPTDTQSAYQSGIFLIRLRNLSKHTLSTLVVC